MTNVIKNYVKDLSLECVDLTKNTVQGATAKELTKFQFADDKDFYHFCGLVRDKHNKFSDDLSYKDIKQKKGVRYHNNGLRKGKKNEVSLIFVLSWFQPFELFQPRASPLNPLPLLPHQKKAFDENARDLPVVVAICIGFP